jgi:hypothetical protein
MLKLKTKWFNKWAKKNSVSDKTLLKTIDNLAKNLGSVNLGAGLYKIRTAKSGQVKEVVTELSLFIGDRRQRFLFTDLGKKKKVIYQGMS